MITIVNKVWMGLINILWPYYMVTVRDTTRGYERFYYERVTAAQGASDQDLLSALGL